MLRDQDRSNSFTPENNAEKDEWVFANIEQMAAHAKSEPVLVDEIFSA
jgi:cytochrome oxidase assembly protein ShyY1